MTYVAPEIRLAQAFYPKVKATDWKVTVPDASGAGGVRTIFEVANFRLTESLKTLPSYSVGDFVVAIYPVRPKLWPSKRDEILVDFWCVPVLSDEGSGKDSDLIATELWDRFRKMVNTNFGVSDTRLYESGVALTDGNIQYWFHEIFFPQDKGTRMPAFQVRYGAHIDPTDGSFN